jgi:hypothetical protein
MPGRLEGLPELWTDWEASKTRVVNFRKRSTDVAARAKDVNMEV